MKHDIGIIGTTMFLAIVFAMLLFGLQQYIALSITVFAILIQAGIAYAADKYYQAQVYLEDAQWENSDEHDLSEAGYRDNEGNPNS